MGKPEEITWEKNLSLEKNFWLLHILIPNLDLVFGSRYQNLVSGSYDFIVLAILLSSQYIFSHKLYS